MDMTERMKKVSRALKRHISDILREEISNPRIELVAITRVEVQKDLRNAKIFYKVIDEEAEGTEIRKGLKSAESFVRTELAKRIAMKFTPKISFLKDVEKKNNQSVEEILKVIERERSNDG